MAIKPFETEEFFAKFDAKQPQMVCASDCESVSISELIELGGGSVDEFLRTKLVYPEMAGGAAIRKEIAAQYKNIHADQVLVLGSPIEGIYLTMNVLLQKGDHVIVLSPAYDALFNVAESVTENVSRWFLKNEDKEWKLDLESLEKLIQKNTKLLIFNVPHNPTGFQPTKTEWKKIQEITQRHGVRVFSDEMYRGLEYSSEHRLPSFCEMDDSAIVLSGASKSLGLAGLRFGWLVAKDPVLYKKLFDFKNYTSMCATQAGEYLGIMALRAGPKLIERNVKIVQKNLKTAGDFFKKWEHRFEWMRPMAGSVSMAKVKGAQAEKLCHEIAERFNVVLLPTKFMGCEDHYVRFGYGREDFAPGLAILDKALGEF